MQVIINTAIENVPGSVFSYKLRYIVGFWLVEMAISTNQKPTIYLNLYKNTGPDLLIVWSKVSELTIINDDALELWYYLSQLPNYVYIHHVFGFWIIEDLQSTPQIALLSYII